MYSGYLTTIALGADDMGRIISFIQNGWWPLEYFISACLLLVALNRRRHFILRLLLGLVGILLVDRIGTTIGAIFLPLPVVLFLICAVMVGVFYLCAELDVWDAIYGAVCAYAVQHLAYAAYSFLTMLLKSEPSLPYFPVFALAMTVCGLLFTKNLTVSGHYEAGPMGAFTATVIIIPFVFYLSERAENYYDMDIQGNQPLFIICRIYAVLCCLFVLSVQTSIRKKAAAESELKTQRILWEKKKEQYELSKEAIDHINHKCHDLKHQITALRTIAEGEQRDRFLNQIEESVMIYDASVKTGNEILDVLLTEKSLICERENIVWTCVADGRQLSFLDPIDLYTLFGNALDNAIENVRKLSQSEQRVISLTVFEKPGLSIIQIENYYEGELHFQDGLPVTSKTDQANHGFGMRSIRNLAEKYGGTISIDTEHSIFLLSITLPHQVK